jgi:tetratricopeptide (TPR) repeat protein
VRLRKARIGDVRLRSEQTAAAKSWVFAALVGIACALIPLLTSASGQSADQQSAPGIFVKGTVRDGAGASVADATVVLEEKGRGSVEGKTGADGSFSFLALRAGTYVVLAKKMGVGDAASEPMKLSPGEKRQVDLVLGAKAGAQKKAADQMEFSDAPNFTVAGVTDWSNAGLHGSDANARTSEALNRETLALNNADERATESAASAKPSAAEAHRLAGDRAEKAGDALSAEREYEAAVRSDPSEANYFSWGTELLVHKAVQPAIEVFTKGAAAHPRSARILIGLGAALFAGNAPQEAARKICAAADLQPSDATAYLFLGKMQSAVGQELPCAKEKLGRFVQEQPGNAQAKYYYAVALWRSVRSAGSVNVEKGKDPPSQSDGAAHAVTPSRNEGCQDGAEPCSAPTKNGEDTLAFQEKLLQEAVRLEPKLGEAHLQLGILYSEQGKFPLAIQAYQNAIGAKHDLADAHYRLGQAYKRIGEQAKAEREFAAYKQVQTAQSAQLERQRKELQQFVVVLKEKK